MTLIEVVIVAAGAVVIVIGLSNVVDRFMRRSGKGAQLVERDEWRDTLLKRMSKVEMDNQRLEAALVEEKRQRAADAARYTQRIEFLEAASAAKDKTIEEMRIRVDTMMTLILQREGAPIATSDKIGMRDFLISAFSMDELKLLIGNLGWEAERIGGDTLDTLAANVVDYAYRRNAENRLREAMQTARPGRVAR